LTGITLGAAATSTKAIANQLSIPPQRARATTVSKPWGSRNLLPWCTSPIPHNDPVGEIWFAPAPGDQFNPGLLLKLLFTEQKLSVQVHPDDTFAQSIGLPNGKSEAWYVLSARDEAQVALGLNRKLNASELRASILDNSIADLIAWHSVKAGDVFFVPAGTIHAIGPGLILAEIQQRSDATFRMFDYGRDRSLHLDQAVAVAKAEPFHLQNSFVRRDKVRTVLVRARSFVLERITLPPMAEHSIKAIQEAWILPIAGDVLFGGLDLEIGEAGYLSGDRATVRSGAEGVTALIAYPGPDIADNLIGEISQMEASA
jgi:mannose-6-phosphate isomerase